jgi:hypothetical protein
VGAFDSSRTRVAPVFNRLLMRDPTGRSWLQRLLELPRYGSKNASPRTDSALVRCGWWPEEVQLPAPEGLLSWLVDNLPELGTAEGKRARLAAGDPETLAEARRLLERRDPRSTARAWYVFEGPTSVDAYLETPGLIVLIEGKRTERGPTTRTTYMPTRHQLLRNLDAGWDIRGERDIVAMFIVEGDEVSDDWQSFARATISREALDGSLPHRASKERAAIAEAFLGVTTWQIMCREFGIPFPPEEDGASR